jgi:signal transduction histidine kinase
VGRTLYELVVPPDLVEEARQATLEAIEVGSMVFESLRRRKDGTVINVDVTNKAVRDGAAYYRIEVEDTGIGIKSEDLSRLFVEFQQLDASSAKKYPGTGLGLALTKRIAEAQGGRVGVNSAPDKGSVFHAILPRCQRDGDTVKESAKTFPEIERI